MIRVMNKGAMSKSLICWLSFNTSFIFEEPASFSIWELDPNGIWKDSRISEEIRIDVYTSPYCYKCTNTTRLDEFCKSCKKELRHEIPKW